MPQHHPGAARCQSIAAARHPIIDVNLGAMVPLLAVPLAEGWSGSIFNFSGLVVEADRTDRFYISYLLVGSREVSTPTGTFDCWEIREYSGGSAYRSATYFVRKSDQLTVQIVRQYGPEEADVLTLTSVTYP